MRPSPLPLIALAILCVTGCPGDNAESRPILDPARSLFTGLPDADSNGEPELFATVATPVAVSLRDEVACGTDFTELAEVRAEWTATFGSFTAPTQVFAGPAALCAFVEAGNTYTAPGNIGFMVLTVTIELTYVDGRRETDTVIQSVEVINGKN